MPSEQPATEEELKVLHKISVFFDTDHDDECDDEGCCSTCIMYKSKQDALKLLRAHVQREVDAARREQQHCAKHGWALERCGSCVKEREQQAVEKAMGEAEQYINHQIKARKSSFIDLGYMEKGRVMRDIQVLEDVKNHLPQAAKAQPPKEG